MRVEGRVVMVGSFRWSSKVKGGGVTGEDVEGAAEEREDRALGQRLRMLHLLPPPDMRRLLRKKRRQGLLKIMSRSTGVSRAHKKQPARRTLQ